MSSAPQRLQIIIPQLSKQYHNNNILPYKQRYTPIDYISAISVALTVNIIDITDIKSSVLQIIMYTDNYITLLTHIQKYNFHSHPNVPQFNIKFMLLLYQIPSSYR